jgi:hypothetical protein
MPSGPVERQNRIGAFGDVVRDFIELELHPIGVGIRKREGRPDIAGRADRAENRWALS